MDGGQPCGKHPAAVVLRSAVKHTRHPQLFIHVLCCFSLNLVSATYNFLVVSMASHTVLMMLEESPLEGLKWPEVCSREKV